MNNKQKIINEYLKQFVNEKSNCCNHSILFYVYKDKNNNFGLEEHEFCWECLECC